MVCYNLLFGDCQGLPTVSVYSDVETVGSEKSRPVSGQAEELLLLDMMLHKSPDLLDFFLLPRCCMSCPRTHNGALISSGVLGTLLSCLRLLLMDESAFTPSWEAAQMA